MGPEGRPWSDSFSAGDRSGTDEILGYHFEQAYKLHAELGPTDGATRLLARRAAELLAAGGQAAHLRGDMSAAANLLTRAVEGRSPVAAANPLPKGLQRSSLFDSMATVVHVGACRLMSSGAVPSGLRGTRRRF